MLHPYTTAFSGKDPAKGVFSIMHSYFETLGNYLLFTKFLTSTNMPTAQQKKGEKIKPYLPCIDGRVKWRQPAHHKLWSQQGPHFSPNSTDKTNGKSTFLPYLGKHAPKPL